MRDRPQLSSTLRCSILSSLFCRKRVVWLEAEMRSDAVAEFERKPRCESSQLRFEGRR